MSLNFGLVAVASQTLDEVTEGSALRSTALDSDGDLIVRR